MNTRHFDVQSLVWSGMLLAAVGCAPESDESHESSQSDASSQRASEDGTETPATDDEVASEEDEPGSESDSPSEDDFPAPVGLSIDSIVISFGTTDITGGTAYVGNALTCLATTAGGTAPISIDYEWIVNTSSSATATGDSYTVDADDVDVTDTLKCSVTADDSAPGKVTDEVSVTIGNSTPSISSVSISSASGATYPASSEALTCSYTGFSDPDEDGDVSTYSWSDGSSVIGTAALLPSSATSVGGTYTCTVTPHDGTAAGADKSAAVTVNTPPVTGSVSILPGALAAYTNTGLTCSVTGSTDVDSGALTSGDHSFEWSSTSGTSIPDGTTVASSYFASGDTLTCTVTANDDVEADATPVTADRTILNSDPTFDTGTVLITNDDTASTSTVNVGETVSCGADNVSDADSGDTLVQTVTWSFPSSSSIIANTYEVAATDVSPGDSITCTFEVDDGAGGSISDIDTISVSNSAPELASASLTPVEVTGVTPLTGEVLRCEAGTVTDPDDPGSTGSYTYSYRWYIGSPPTDYTSHAEANTSLGYDEISTGFGYGDDVYCTISVKDSDGSSSSSVPSSTETIQNTPPEIASVVITADTGTAYEASTLTCTPDTATDADSTYGDSITFSYAYSWNIDDEGLGTSVSTVTTGATNTLGGTNFDKDDVVSCSVVPNDGTDNGPSTDSTGSLTIANTVPTASGVTITPDPAIASDTLTCNYTFADQDAPDFTDSSTFSWLVDGVDPGTVTSTHSGMTAADVITCTVTPNDGEDNGTPVPSSAITVNSPPVISNIDLVVDGSSVTDIYTDHTIGLDIVTTDADALDTSFTYTYVWTVEGTSPGSPADEGSTLDGVSYFSVGDTVEVTVTPHDGHEEGSPFGPVSTEILNTDPVISSVTIDPLAGGPAGTELECEAVYSDADDEVGDLTVEYDWYVIADGTTTETQVADDSATWTIDAGLAQPADTIFCRATVEDLNSGTVTDDSSNATMENTPPVPATPIITSPDGTYQVGDTLTCTGEASDDDGGTPTLTYVWTNSATPTADEIDIGDTGTSEYVIAGSDTTPEEDITCTVTATDTSGDSGSSDASVTIENTTPVVGSIDVQLSGVTATEAYVDDQLDCVVTASDADDPTGTEPALTYEWWISGGVSAFETGSAYVLDPDHIDVADEIYCVVLATDDFGLTDTANTSTGTVEVLNTLPVLTSASLSPSVIYDVDEVTCEPGTPTDADDHSVTFEYEWEVDGTIVSGETTSTLADWSDETDGNDNSVTINCLVTPVDVLGDAALTATETGETTAIDCDVDNDDYRIQECVDILGSGDVDCDDFDEDINPSLEEDQTADSALTAAYVGNDVDEDCSGYIVCYNDNDKDGYGNESQDFSEGPEASGGVATGGTNACGSDDNDTWDDDYLDCDDEEDGTHPGAAALDSPTECMADVDGDGYGSVSSPGATGVAGNDCDDGDISVNPCAVEVCDGEDNDCDGRLDTSDGSYGVNPTDTSLNSNYTTDVASGGVLDSYELGTYTCTDTVDAEDDLSIAYLFYLDEDDDGFGGLCSDASDIEDLTEEVEADGCCCNSADSSYPCDSSGGNDDSSCDTTSNYCDGDGTCESGEACIEQAVDEEVDCADIIECGEAAPSGFVSKCGCPDSTGTATFYCDANDDGYIDDGEISHIFDPCDGFDCEVVQDEQTGSARSECTTSTVTFYNTTEADFEEPIPGVFKFGSLDEDSSLEEGVEDSGSDGINDCGTGSKSYYIDNDADDLYADDVLCCFDYPDPSDTYTVYDTTLDRTAWSHNVSPSTTSSIEDTLADGCHGPYVWFYGPEHSDSSIGYPEDLVSDEEPLDYDALDEDQYAIFELFGDDTLDCDDADEYQFPGASEVCDGQRNDCMDSSAVDMTEVDTDNDGYVVCDFDGDGIGDGYTGAVPWAGSTSVNVGEDCDPSDPNTYPFAGEVCDGIYNNCNSRESSTELAPSNELDDDGDGYVECFDGTTSWAGADVPETGQDCDDTNVLVYPEAVEYCDGVFNDCDALLYDSQEAPDPELDEDGDGYVACESELDYAGIYAYDPLIWSGSTISGDGDCNPLDATVYPLAEEVCDGIDNNCDDEFMAADDGTDAESDEDGDGYVECAYSLSTWQGSGDVVGGDDCDDIDTEVFPGATEVCDGQYNDCADSGYVDGGSPEDESDDDGDGFVECERSNPSLANTPPWAGDGSDPYDLCPGSDTCYDCDDTDSATYPGAAGLEIEDYAECMTDADGDGYGDLSAVEPVVAGTDCDDSLENVHPGAEEVCEPSGEQTDDDCDGSPNTEGGLPLEPSDSEMVGYLDEDGDGFGDPDQEASICVSGEGYSLTGTDCNDSDPSKYPGAPELCNDADDDCDEITDEADDLDPELSGCVDMYRDVDQDLYGDGDITACLCLDSDSATSENDGDQYVLTSGDCDDYNSNTHPLSCEDGIDNDQDDLEDALDPDCIAGLNEQGTEVETRIEYMDGDDNDCDGYVPVFELDCDDDGALPILPRRVSLAETASEVDLLPCDKTVGFDVSNPYTYVECWDQKMIQLVCDREGEAGGVGASGFWMLRYEESEDGYGGRYDGGDRVYEEIVGCDMVGDCDDLCASRCPGQTESCDGVDNDCTDTDDFYVDEDGIPDAVLSTGDVAGTVSIEEFDLDLDGYLNCDDFSAGSEQVHYTSASCDEQVVEADLLVDCNNQCSLTNPAVEERCNGFLDLCGGEAEGVDQDRDDFRTCGAWSSGIEGGDDMTEDSHMVIWVRGASALNLGEEEEETSVDTGESAVDTSTGSSDSGSADSGSADSGSADSGSADSGSADSGSADSGTTGSVSDSATDSGDTGADESQGIVSTLSEAAYVPLILPRTMYCENPDLDYTRRELRNAQQVIECDEELYQQLTKIIDSETVDEAMAECDATLLLEACSDPLEEGGCGLVQISLDSTIDQDTRSDYIDQAMLAGYHSASCDALPEQYVSRSTWTHRRILEARKNVIEFECLRMYGETCDQVDETTPLIGTWNELADASVALAVELRWWKEVDRFEPEAMTTGTLGHCWGDPGDGFGSVSQETGGDCNDESGKSHRDNLEGPGDLLGIYYGLPVDCATCLDGIDNNCDGQTDCADPACAACFVGQGYGCGAGESNPCSETGGGCSTSRYTSDSQFKRLYVVVLLGLFAVALRRRSNS